MQDKQLIKQQIKDLSDQLNGKLREMYNEVKGKADEGTRLMREFFDSVSNAGENMRPAKRKGLEAMTCFEDFKELRENFMEILGDHLQGTEPLYNELKETEVRLSKQLEDVAEEMERVMKEHWKLQEEKEKKKSSWF